jgi:hypothetical protein
MKYRVTISDEKKTVRVALIILISFIAFEFIAFFVLSYGFDKRRIFDFVFLTSLPIYMIALYLGVYKKLFKEEIELKDGFIATQHFGKISLNEIGKYAFKESRGIFKLTLLLKGGQKLAIIPARSEKALEEFISFCDDFEKQMKN